MIGVTEQELNIIKSIIQPYKDEYKFFVYGSRVKGNFRPLSDLDLMIKGKTHANLNDIENLKDDFDNSNLSYIVNIADYYNISESFYDIIKKDLVEI